jgi:hypothetical protein
MRKLIRWSLAALLAIAFAASVQARADDLFRGIGDFDGRKIGHVWIIVLENEGFDTTFGPNSLAPFLAKTLPSQGVMLNQYYATGHVSLDNYIAMISGQAATVQTRVDCTFYDDLELTGITSDGQAIGTGCVYPRQIRTNRPLAASRWSRSMARRKLRSTRSTKPRGRRRSRVATSMPHGTTPSSTSIR